MLNIPPAQIPPNSDYQWVTKSVCGDESLGQIAEMERAGWRAVPLARHPSAGGKSVSREHIEYGGLLLMERPKYLTERAASWEAEKAAAQLTAGRRVHVPRKTGFKEFFVREGWKLRVWGRNTLRNLTAKKGTP